MKSLKIALAAAAVVGIAACGSESTGPTSFKSPTSARFALGDIGTDATPVLGKLKVCKSGNVAGEFTIGRTAFGPASTGSALTSATVQPGQCVVVAEDGSGSGSASDITVDETSAGFVSVSALGTDGAASFTDGVTALRINSFHGFTVTYVNHVEESHICTYTKGWYRNNGSGTIIAVDGRTVGQEQQIFAATPGKPGAVTWGADNNNLNLYQQLLAALNNLGGDPTAGPPAVDAAIASALAATSGTGTAIIVAPGTDVSGLIDVLSAFNEGTLAGFPHCAE